jgi:predicted nucleic acid-binding protein
MHVAIYVKSSRTNMTVLIDTNFLISVLIADDINHDIAVAALPQIKLQRAVVAAPVLVEVFYLVEKYAGYPAAIKSIQETRRLYSVEPLTNLDFQEMESVMTRYQDAHLDYTDVAIMVLAERLNVVQIYTFDRRDFMIFRPRHCDAFEMLPSSKR